MPRYNPVMNMTIHPARAEHRVTALRLLFARFPVEEHEARLQEALLASERGSLDLNHLLLAESGGQAVGSALVMLQSDGIALIWPPVISCGAEDPRVVEDGLMEELCRVVDVTPGIRLCQCLLSPSDEVEAEILKRHGFEWVTDMFFLARAASPNDVRCETNAPDQGLEIETYQPENADRFRILIEETYKESLDCPHLTAVRTGAEAIAGHKLSGQFDPSRWFLYREAGRDAGVMLLNAHPDQGAFELVYIGVAPAARGKGLGRRMLRDGLAQAVESGAAVVFLAVDCENHFANSLYSEFDFAELARRRIMLRRPGQLARQ